MKKRTRNYFVINEPLLKDIDSGGCKGFKIKQEDMGNSYISELSNIPEHLVRKDRPNLPALAEIQVVRHFTRLSKQNYCIEDGIFPLGSCTMKYNPKINSDIANLPGFTRIHPYACEMLSQGALEVLYELKRSLMHITGLNACSLMPNAGAHGELVGMKLIKAYFEKKNEDRHTVLIPDTAHGTNPSSAHLAGFKAKEIKSSKSGYLDAATIEKYLTKDIAALMITNPNTLGIFEKEVQQISELLRKNDSLLYIDGANLNAILGRVRFFDMGADVVHLNLHKTFSTPHGGGGPGAGPICVSERLRPFLPVPNIEKDPESGLFYLDMDYPDSIGRVRAFTGNFGVLVRALVYIKMLGEEGLKNVSAIAALNANYVKAKLKDHYFLPYSEDTLHEVVFTHKFQKDKGIRVADIAKRLIDKGYHPPTVSFPLVVHGALMIEPTETESKEELDGFINAMIEIAKESEEDKELIKNSPRMAPSRRLDEVRAAKEPILTWNHL